MSSSMNDGGGGAVLRALKNTPFAIAYRFAAEYTLLKRALETFDPAGEMGLDALDQAVLMKALPRIAGEADYVRESVYGAEADCTTVKSGGLMAELKKMRNGGGKTKSLAKIEEILARAKATGSMAINFWP